MNFEDIDEKNWEIYNSSVNHPLQTFEWGEFRKKTGVALIRRGQIEEGKIVNPYQITIHKTPAFPYLIGYFPKGQLPSHELLSELKDTGREKGISFIQLEPNVENSTSLTVDPWLKNSFHSLFTKYTFIIDLEKTEDDLLKSMHQKTRYNIKISQKHNVEVKIDNSDNAFGDYLRLTQETTKRQKFYAHGEKYHQDMWQTFGSKNQKFDPNKLQAHLLTAKYKNQTLVTYILFTFKDTLYYPYGASSEEHREVMASTGAMWEAIKFGKSLGLKKFDMWGAANVADPKPNDPYYGFHRFKQGFGAVLTEFMGSFDLVINPLNYRLLSVADKIRWTYLKARRN